MCKAAIHNLFVNNMSHLAPTSPSKNNSGKSSGILSLKRTLPTSGEDESSVLKRTKSNATDHLLVTTDSQETPPTPTCLNTPPFALTNNSSGILSTVSTHSSSSLCRIDGSTQLRQKEGLMASMATINEDDDPVDAVEDPTGSYIDLTSDQLEELSSRDYSVSFVVDCGCRGCCCL
jgi:hypothetical protein